MYFLYITHFNRQHLSLEYKLKSAFLAGRLLKVQSCPMGHRIAIYFMVNIVCTVDDIVSIIGPLLCDSVFLVKFRRENMRKPLIRTFSKSPFFTQLFI